MGLFACGKESRHGMADCVIGRIGCGLGIMDCVVGSCWEWLVEGVDVLWGRGGRV